VKQIDSKRDKTKSHVFVVIENFLAKEAYSGFLLFGAALLAMILANSPWSDSYFDLWHTSGGLSIGDHKLEMDLSHWVNDGLMAIFFLLIGLEIKRELVVGELSTLRKAAFPLVGALGGMLVPVLFYLLVNRQSGGDISGFGIPMATDIAFALGVLLLLGNRIPSALKVFLVSLAVVDDLGAIILIAVFYTSSLDLAALGYAGITLVGLIMLNRTGINEILPYLVLGIVLWFWVWESGIHPTIAGVLLAITIPVRARIDSNRFLDICRGELNSFDRSGFNRKDMLLTSEQQDSLEKLEDAYEAVQNPLVRLEHRIHPISAFIAMPIFALANAGVQISGLSSSVFNSVSLGIVLGLVVGKPLGIVGATYFAARMGWVQKPAAISWKHIFGAAMLGGVGFTMSIFIAYLAFEDADLVSSAKIFILASSLIMGIIGALYLLRACGRKQGSSKLPDTSPLL